MNSVGEIVDLERERTSHLLVEETAEILRRLPLEDKGQIPVVRGKCLKMAVYRNSVPRALKIWNEVIAHSATRGISIRLTPACSSGHDSSDWLTQFVTGEDAIDVRMEQTQDYSRLTPGQPLHYLNGITQSLYGVHGALRFHIDTDVSTCQWRIWHDKPGLPLEQQIGNIVWGIERSLRAVKRNRLMRENGGKWIEPDLRRRSELALPYLKRWELYELVWMKPIQLLGLDLGICGTSIGKACVQYKIPKPAYGYWAKRRAKRPIEAKPALLPDANLDKEKIYFYPAIAQEGLVDLSGRNQEWPEVAKFIAVLKTRRRREKLTQERLERLRREKMKQSEKERKARQREMAREEYLRPVRAWIGAVERNAKSAGQETGPHSKIGDWIALANALANTTDLTNEIDRFISKKEPKQQGYELASRLYNMNSCSGRNWRD